MARTKDTRTSHPWDARYPVGVDWEGVLEERPLTALLEDSVAAFPDRPALDFMGRRYTYAEVGDLADRAARGLEDLGVGRGDRVGLLLPNTPYFVILYYAALKVGAMVVNYNPLYSEREIARQVDDSGTSVLATLDLAGLYPKAAAQLDRTCLRTVVVCRMADILPFPKKTLYPLARRRETASIPRDGRHATFSWLVSRGTDYRRVEIEPATQVALLQYTGGTTGVSKGAMLTHANLVANVDQCRAWFVDLEPGAERMLGVLPFFHVFAMTVAMNMSMAVGAEIALVPRWDLRRVLDTIEKKRPTLFPGVPTMYTAIDGAPGIERRDLSSIKFCISGGAPLPGEVKREFERLTGCTLVEGYGLTEASPVVSCNPIQGLNKLGSIGLPFPRTVIDIRSLDDPSRSLPVGERGEICVTGPQVMLGYWNMPEETDRVLVDGLLHTADVGHMDEEGYTFIVDRIKDLILCSGYNVYPRVIEEALYEHPDVHEACVIGVPDDYRGEAPKAFVTPVPGASVTAEKLLTHLRSVLSPIEVPREVEFRAELPRTLVGKLSKKELIEEERAKREGGG